MRKVIKLLFSCVDRYFCWFVAINRYFWNCNEGGILWQYGYKRLYLGNHADIQSSWGLLGGWMGMLM